MLSPSLRKQRGNKTAACFVERADLLDTLINSVDSPGSLVSTSAKSVGSSQSRTGGGSKLSPDKGGLSGSPEKSGSLSVSLPGSQSGAEIQAKMLLERNRMLRENKKEKHFSDLQNSLKESLEFLDNVDRELSLFNETRRTKTRRQFEEWNKSVHGKIQENIQKKVNEISATELHNRKLESYDKFLAITNRKPAIFRDIIIESEYDPLEINRTAIKAKTGRLKDPLNIDRQKAENELAMVGSRLVDDYNTNDRLAVSLWAKGKIESTPYGMFATMMNDDDRAGSAGSRTRPENQNRKGASRVVFDDFNYPVGKEAVDAEMPPPKPRMRKVYAEPAIPYTDPNTGGHYPPEFMKSLQRIGQTGKL